MTNANRGPRILVTDDEPAIRRAVSTNLTRHGYRVEEAENGQQALEKLTTFRPDLLVLDLSLPDIDGLQVIQSIRERVSTPIIVLSVREGEKDKVSALDFGADDYLTKPFSVNELLARIRVALRHIAQPTSTPIFHTGDLEVNLEHRRVRLATREIDLSPTEYDLLKVFVAHPDRVLTHAMLVHEVWGPEYGSESHYLHVYVARLRFPLTIRRMLLNETYTGRTVFRRTKSDKYRDSRTGKTKRVISQRDEADWIEVTGATPAIVSVDLFNRVNAILMAPDRRSKNRPSRAYPLRGRLRCALCGSAMVGQSLQKGLYSYYRCRHSYGNRWERNCSSKYVRSERLEGAVLSALSDLLANPGRVLAEARRVQSSEIPTAELAEVSAALEKVEARQRRLVRLFTEGELPHDLLEEQRGELSRERSILEIQRQALEGHSTRNVDLGRIERELPRVLGLIRGWVEGADSARFDLLLRGVDAQIKASNEKLTINGSIPLIESAESFDLVTIERTSA